MKATSFTTGVVSDKSEDDTVVLVVSKHEFAVILDALEFYSNPDQFPEDYSRDKFQAKKLVQFLGPNIGNIWEGETNE